METWCGGRAVKRPSLVVHLLHAAWRAARLAHSPPHPSDMLTSHRSLGNLSTPEKSIRKQQSESFGGNTRRRNPSQAALGPRPASEFGWQLALQGSSLDAKGTIIEEESPAEVQDGSDPPNHSLQDGAGKPTLNDPPPYQFSSDGHHRSGSAIASSSSSSTKKDLVEKYADKDIGWQLVLQGQEIPSNTPSERSPVRGNSNPYSRVDVTSRESPRPTHSLFNQSSNGNVDSFQHLNLDEAAKVYSGFSTQEKGPANDGVKSPRATHTPPYLANNPFHAMIQAAEGSKAPSQPLIDLEEKAVVLPNLLEDLTLNTSPQPAAAPLPRRSEDSVRDEELLGCEYCPKRVALRRISQIPLCLHLVCHTCLLNHVEKQLFDSYFPIKCPMCLLLEEQSDDDPEVRVPIAQGGASNVLFLRLIAPANFEPISCDPGDRAKLPSIGPIYLQYLPGVPDIVTI